MIIKVDRDTELAKMLLSFVENCSWDGVKDHIADMLRSWRYLKEKGFGRSYIPAEFFGLYEHYGYRYLKDIVNYDGGTDHLFVKDF